mgnify:CR=1 FL=1
MGQGHTGIQFIRRSSSSAERIHADLLADFINARFDIDPLERRASARSRTTCAFGHIRIHRTECIGGEMSGTPRGFVDIGITIRGGLAVKAGQCETVSGAGAISGWSPPNEKVTVRAHPGSMIYSLCLRPERLAEAGRATFGQGFKLPPRPVAQLPEGLGAVLARNVGSVFSELAELEKNGLGSLALGPYEDLLARLALAVVRPDLLSEKPETGSAPDWMLTRAEEILHERAMEPLKISAVAAELGVTVRSLQLAFRKARGCSPLQFLINRRIALARDRLLDPNLSANVQAVAADCGIVDLSRFSARYKATFGETPSETLARRAPDRGTRDCIRTSSRPSG